MPPASSSPASSSPALALTVCLADLPDPRVERTRLHSLTDLIVVAVCAVLCGAEGWDDIVVFAHAKEDWLRQRLPLEHGIPCADTFRRVFARLDPEAFTDAFTRWVEALRQSVEAKRRKKAGTPPTDPGIIALDGKTLRHSFDTASATSPIHMVSAFAQDARLVLAQVKVDDKSNEITAVPALLALLDSPQASSPPTP